MVEIRQTAVFSAWLAALRDERAQARIAQRLRYLGMGDFGDVQSVGAGVSELRVHYGPGYRVYFVKRGLEIVILLCGGDKSTQDRDIKTAHQLAREV